MAFTEHALPTIRDHVSVLSSSVCVPYVRHPHQKKGTVLRFKLFYALSDHDGFNNPLLLPAIGDRGANGCWYNSIAVTKHYTADPVRLATAYVRGTADRGVLRAHHVKHFHVAGFLLHCPYIVSPFTVSAAPLAEGSTLRMGNQTIANATGMEQNKREEKTSGEERKISAYGDGF